MGRCLKSITTLAVLACLAPIAAAQGGARMNSALSSATFAKIFGNNAAFTATAEMHVTHKDGKHNRNIEMQYFVRDGKVRMNMNLAKMGEQIPPEALSRMKRLGMERYIIILHPGTDQRAVMMYPDIRAYVELNARAPGKHNNSPQITKTRVGTDTVDGHPCVKYKLTVTRPDGSHGHMTEWEATDLHNFPIKLAMSDNTTASSIVFKHIDHTPPDASLFDVPGHYKRYDSLQQLMISQMKHHLGNLGSMLHMHRQH